jgi:hypothetical protein
VQFDIRISIDGDVQVVAVPTATEADVGGLSVEVITAEEEQIVIVLEGEMEFELDGVVRTMRPGDVAIAPPWVPHGAHTNETGCYEVDVFNPPRKTLLDHAAAQAAKNAATPAAGGDESPSA